MENNITPTIVETEAGKTYAWCSCGQSKNMPYCDGAHKGVEGHSGPVLQTMTESGKVAICACGKSANSVYCDGSHKPKQ